MIETRQLIKRLLQLRRLLKQKETLNPAEQLQHECELQEVKSRLLQRLCSLGLAFLRRMIWLHSKRELLELLLSLLSQIIGG